MGRLWMPNEIDFLKGKELWSVEIYPLSSRFSENYCGTIEDIQPIDNGYVIAYSRGTTDKIFKTGEISRENLVALANWGYIYSQTEDTYYHIPKPLID